MGKKDYIDEIPPEYRKIQPGRDQNFTLGEFSDVATLENLPFLLMRLGHESQDEGFQLLILEEVAKKINKPVADLWRMLREHKKPSNRKELFRFLSVDELHSNTGPTEWLIKSYLEKESLAMLFGKSGSLKSFAAIDMGLCIATGTDWHGNPVGRGPVFYICGEGQKGISRRLRAWELHNGKGVSKAPFFVSNRPAQFLNEQSAMDVAGAVNELCDQHGKPVLIIVDTLNRNFGPGDENNTADMTNFVQVLDCDLRHPFCCTVLLVHHTGLRDQERARGPYSLHAALDWIYKAEKQDKLLCIVNQKAKDFENLPPLYLKSEIITLDREEDDGKPMTSLILKSTTDTFKHNRPLSGADKIAYDALLESIKENRGNPIHIDTWRMAAYQANISTSDKPDTKQKAFKRAIDHLQKEGLVETKDDYWRPTPDTGQEEDI